MIGRERRPAGNIDRTKEKSMEDNILDDKPEVIVDEQPKGGRYRTTNQTSRI